MKILFFALALFLSMFSKLLAQPCILICHDTKISLGTNGEALLTPSMLVDAAFCNNDSLKVQVLSLDGNEILPYAHSHILTCASLGRRGNFKVRIAEIKNNVIGTFCNLSLTVFDPHQTCVYPSAACAASSMVCNQDITVSLDESNQFLLTPEVGGVNIHPDCKDFMKVVLYSWDTLELLPMKASHLLDCKYVGKFQVANLIYLDSASFDYCWYDLTIIDTNVDCPPIKNCELTCKDLTVSIDVNGDAFISANQVMDDNEYLPCKEDLRIRIRDLNANVILPFSTSHKFQCQTLGTYKVEARVIHNGIQKNSCWSTLEVNDNSNNCSNSSLCILQCNNSTINLNASGKVKLNWQSFGLQAQCNTDSLMVSISNENGIELLPFASNHILDCSYLGKFKVRMAEVVNGVVGTNCMSTITIKDPLQTCKDCIFELCDFELDVNLDVNGLGTLDWDVALLPDSYIGDCESLFRIRVYTYEGDVFPYGRSHAIDCSMVGDYFVGTSLLKNGIYSLGCFTIIHIKDPFQKCTVGAENYPLTLESKFKGPFVNEITLNDVSLNKIHYSLFELPKANIINGNKTIKFKGKKQKLNGANTLDLVNMIKYLLEEDTPTPLEAILSDFDRSGFIGINDIISLRKAIIGLAPKENEFIFLKKGITFPTSFDPFNFGTDVYNYTFDGQNAANENFTFNAYLTGDVNLSGSFTTDKDEENRNSISLNYDDLNMVAGQTYKVEFKSENIDQLRGMQAAITFSEASIVSASSESNNQFLTNSNEHTIKLSFLSQQNTSGIAFSINILAQRDGKLSDFISLDKSIDPMFVSSDLNVASLKLNSNQTSSTAQLNDGKISITPNPSNGNVSIVLGKAMNNNVSIFALDGKLIYQFQQSSNVIDLNAAMFNGQGMFIVKLKNEDGNFAGKVIIK